MPTVDDDHPGHANDVRQRQSIDRQSAFDRPFLLPSGYANSNGRMFNLTSRRSFVFPQNREAATLKRQSTVSLNPFNPLLGFTSDHPCLQAHFKTDSCSL